MARSSDKQAKEDARRGRKPDPNSSGQTKKDYDRIYNDEKKQNS
jgi:hypothetical protein